MNIRHNAPARGGTRLKLAVSRRTPTDFDAASSAAYKRPSLGNAELPRARPQIRGERDARNRLRPEIIRRLFDARDQFKYDVGELAHIHATFPG